MHIMKSFQDGDFQCVGMENKVRDFPDEFKHLSFYFFKKGIQIQRKLLF